MTKTSDPKHYGKGWWLASMVCDHPRCKEQTEWALRKFYEANGIEFPAKKPNTDQKGEGQ